MGFLNNISFARKQLLLGLGLGALSFLIVLVMQFACRLHMIGSKNYFEIESAMDLVADILPPPAYLIELYLVVKELPETEDRWKREQLVNKARSRQAEYMTRLEHWTKTLPNDEVRIAFNESSETALRFIGAIEKRFLPLIESNRLDEAQKVAEMDLKPLFEAHRDAIEKTVPYALRKRISISENAIAKSDFFLIAAIVYSMLGLGLAVFLYWRIGLSMSWRIVALQKSAAAIANGDLVHDNSDTSTDEIGNTHCSQNAVKQSLLMLTDDIQRLVTAARGGNLTARANPKKYQGVYRELVKGLNETLSAVSAPILEAVGVLAMVAKGDLSNKVTGVYAGQFDFVKRSINGAFECLSKSLARVALGAEQVEAASCQISDGSRSLAKSAANQASTLATITLSLEQISAATSQGASNTQIGLNLAKECQLSVEQGTRAMLKMSQAIDKIQHCSGASALIVKTIDEIAFQTNILSLNAAVEAARAGESGNGFAVVANEFRNLALQTADAARVTASMIEDSVQSADSGVLITTEMGSILNEICNGSNKLSDLMSSIANASQDQSREIEHVNQALLELADMTRETAEASVQSAYAAGELNKQASALSDTVSAFKLSDCGFANLCTTV